MAPAPLNSRLNRGVEWALQGWRVPTPSSVLWGRPCVARQVACGQEGRPGLGGWVWLPGAHREHWCAVSIFPAWFTDLCLPP